MPKQTAKIADYNFPEDFLWGASIASHQIEGGTYNQWTVWELENAARLAKTAEQRYSWLPVWPKIKDRASRPDNYVSGEGVDHWNRYEHDLDIAKALNLTAFRFSIEWSRIEPEEGTWDETAIDHYRTYIKAVKQRGLEPVLNLWHWTNPVWFEEKGSFTKRANIKYFLRFAANIIEELGDELNYVLILNEPNVYAYFSYMTGNWPPAEKSRFKFVKVYTTLASTHRQAYGLLKKLAPHIQYSSAPQLALGVPKDPGNIWHRLSSYIHNFLNNWLWLLLTKRYYDFIGFNNYFKDYVVGVGFKSSDNPKHPLNDLGWYMEPAGVAEMALAIHRRYPGMPIMITENGVADAADQHRQWWIEETLKALSSVIQQGVNLKGYFHWSLLDNFEWAEGWWPKFGLIAVDREKGMKRTVRPSAKWFAKQLASIRAKTNT